MALNYIAISGLCTVLSFVGLQLWTESSLGQLKSDGLIPENSPSAGNVVHVVDLLLGSYTTIALLANFVLNVFILLVLFLKVSLLFRYETCAMCIVTLMDAWNYVKTHLAMSLYEFILIHFSWQRRKVQIP